MIPKIIHYCWFGGNAKPQLAKKCIASWKKYCSDYELREWNEDSYDLSKAPLYVRQAYDAKKWAFVTDYVRLQVVYEHGGIYLDTDVEVIRNPDELLSNTAFFGFEGTENINTGLGFGAEAKHTLLKALMLDYQDASFISESGEMDLTPCPVRNTRVFSRYGLKSDGTMQRLVDGTLILPPEYLCPIDIHTMKLEQTENTYTIHHFAGAWLPEEAAKRQKYKLRKLRIEHKFGARAAGIYESFYYSRKVNGGNGVYAYLKGIAARRFRKEK